MRDTVGDRRNVCGHIPILLQEWVQCALWQEIQPSDTQESCSARNRGYSFTIVVIIHSVPLFLSLKSRLGLDGRCSKRHRLLLQKNLRRCILWLGIISSLTGLLMLEGAWMSCTVIGPFHHQIWPAILVPDPIANEDRMPFRMLMWVLYLVCVSQPVNLNPAPDLANLLLIFAGP